MKVSTFVALPTLVVAVTVTLDVPGSAAVPSISPAVMSIVSPDGSP